MLKFHLVFLTGTHYDSVNFTFQGRKLMNRWYIKDSGLCVHAHVCAKHRYRNINFE